MNQSVTSDYKHIYKAVQMSNATKPVEARMNRR